MSTGVASLVCSDLSQNQCCNAKSRMATCHVAISRQPYFVPMFAYTHMKFYYIVWQIHQFGSSSIVQLVVDYQLATAISLIKLWTVAFVMSCIGENLISAPVDGNVTKSTSLPTISNPSKWSNRGCPLVNLYLSESTSKFGLELIQETSQNTWPWLSSKCNCYEERQSLSQQWSQEPSDTVLHLSLPLKEPHHHMNPERHKPSWHHHLQHQRCVQGRFFPAVLSWIPEQQESTKWGGN